MYVEIGGSASGCLQILGWAQSKSNFFLSKNLTHLLYFIFEQCMYSASSKCVAPMPDIRDLLTYFAAEFMQLAIEYIRKIFGGVTP